MSDKTLKQQIVEKEELYSDGENRIEQLKQIQRNLKVQIIKLKKLDAKVDETLNPETSAETLVEITSKLK